jgi:hypothetical protein
VLLTAVVLGLAVAAPVAAQDDVDPADEEVEVTGGDGVVTTEFQRVPLVPVPPGCEQVPLPHVVFVGAVVDSDYRTARFEIGQVRAGDPAPFAVDSVIDVRYGLDVQYLDVGSEYLVATSPDPVLGLLVSRIREPAPNFGGDDIVGLAEADVECPELDDPIRTMMVDGTPIKTSVLAPLLDQRGRLLGALVIPFAAVFAVVFLLAMLRLGVDGVARGIGNVGRRGRR